MSFTYNKPFNQDTFKGGKKEPNNKNSKKYSKLEERTDSTNKRFNKSGENLPAERILSIKQ